MTKREKRKMTKKEDEEDKEMEEGEILPPYHPTFQTTSTNTNPFTLKRGKTIGGSKKKKVKKKDTL